MSKVNLPMPALSIDPTATDFDLVDLRDQSLRKLEGMVSAFMNSALAAEQGRVELPTVPSTCWWALLDQVELLREAIVELDARGWSPEPSIKAGGAA